MSNRANAYTEVYIILQDLEEEEFYKIPPEIVSAIEQNRNKEYNFELDEDLALKEQELLPQTKAILFNLFRDYLSTPKQREKIIQMQAKDRERIEEEKQKTYNSSDLFKKKEDIDQSTEQTALVEIPKENFFRKIINKIKNFFNR